MDAVEFIKERKRYCMNIDMDCSTCGLSNEGIRCGYMNGIDNPKALVDFIEQWSKEHPKMTNADKLLEVFGKFRLSNITPEWLRQEYREPKGKK